MLFKIWDCEPGLFYLQRCFFPSIVPPDHYGKYAFLNTSDGSTYFIRICVEPLLQDNICILDRSVESFPGLEGVSREQDLLYENLNIVSSINYIKTAHIELVFKSIWDFQKWSNKSELYIDILRQILKLFVLTNNFVLKIHNVPEINQLNLHSIIIKDIGKIVAGKFVDNTKLQITKATSYGRFKACQEICVSNICGLNSYRSSLHEHFSSLVKRKSNLSPLLFTSSLKVLIIGPDGSGKKSLIFNVASEFGAVVVTIDGPELSRPQPGETERLLKEKFDEALLHSEEGITALLIIRIESVCSKEGRILSEFLHLLDSIPPTCPLIVVATTSKPHLLHDSIRSSARFHNRIILNIPTEKERFEMIYDLCEGVLSTDNALELAKKTPGFVLADINLLVTRAKSKVRLDSLSSNLNEEDLFKTLNECIYQIEPSSLRGELGIVKAEKLDVNDLGGLTNIKRVLIQSIQWPLMYPEAFSRLGIQRPSGVLLYGPPGCAKTSLAKALASSSNVTFLSVSAADLYSPYVGDAEITITDLFQRARDASPSVLFIDEIDALVGSREDKHRGAQERILSTFLVEMDGIGIKGESLGGDDFVETKVTVIAATNRPDSVDPALLRPGRLDKLIYVPPPSLEDRLDILKVLTQSVPLSDCVNLNYIAEKTVLYSGADLKSLCQEAALQALTNDGMNAELVKHDHWLKALKEIPPSLTKHQVDWYNAFSFS